MRYDYLVIGAGLYGATFARLAAMRNQRVLVLEKRGCFGGNSADSKTASGILVHEHGAHIFHTSNEDLWKFVNMYETFKPFENHVKALSGGNLYSMPFNLNTLNQVFHTIWPADAIAALDNERRKYATVEPKNLEEQARKLVGDTIFELLVRDYTEKQWGRPCTELSPELIKRLPVRTTYDNNYFNDTYQGLPVNGYSVLVKNLLDHHNIDVQLMTDFKREDWTSNKYNAKILVYTGSIDEFYDFEFGPLGYRTLRFDTQVMPTENYQGCPVLNRCDMSVKYTRSIEHKHFLNTKANDTIVTFEYPKQFEPGDERYYPINDDGNTARYKQYKALADKDKNIIFGGRLGTYSYLNMDQVMEQAFRDVIRSTPDDCN